ncbi:MULTISPECIES: hypothetical protein [unclassified Moraxella]|uniref:hypothetical protein n=1 Tax=unclassified Moraxella TaxID=2685852 RepID=UPI003AF6BB46
MPTTTQQVNTLVHYLTTQQTPPFAWLFGAVLQKIRFDFSPTSLEQLRQLFAQLSQKNITLDKLLAQQGGNHFVLAIASYLGEYLAKSTGKPIVWLDYHEAKAEIEQKALANATPLQLPASFENSLTAKIGEVYCQPLKLMPSLLKGEPVLQAFISQTEQAIFDTEQVNLLDDPNQVASDYLAKIQTGKLLDKSIGFFEQLQAIEFDFSHNSLVQVDKALAEIAQQQGLTTSHYGAFISDPSQQAMLYLLGFYIGATSSQLANVPISWANHAQMRAMLEDDSFIHCIEHSFVLLMENHYRTPILVLTNRLFGIAPNFPNSSVAFAKLVDEQNRGEMAIFPISRINLPIDLPNSLSKVWQKSLKTASKLVVHQLNQALQQQAIVPTLLSLTKDFSTGQYKVDNQPFISADTDKAMDSLYRQLHENPSLSPFAIATFPMFANLPLGRSEALGLEIKIYSIAPNDANDNQLNAVQFILPYKIDNFKDGLADNTDVVIYPIVNNQQLNNQKLNNQKLGDLSANPQTLAEIVAVLIQALQAQSLKTADGQDLTWADIAVDSLNPWQHSPRFIQEQQQQLVNQQQRVNSINLPILPMLSTDLTSNSAAILGETVTTNLDATGLATGLSVAVAPFEYADLSWQGYDLPKFILDTPNEQKEYLQVVASDSLINDELFSQAEAMTQLYRRGKVVWGAVVKVDNALSLQVYDNLPTAQQLLQQPLVTADIIYDPTGQASVGELRGASEQLQKLMTASEPLSPSQDFIAMHLNDPRSRLFGVALSNGVLPNTPSHAEGQANLCLSSVWVWREHLPNALLSDTIVPIIILPDGMGEGATANIQANAQASTGRVMILPSRLWRTDFYQYWLAKSYQQFGKALDIMPKIEWQEQQGFRYVNKGIDARLFPKFKLNATTASPAVVNNMPSNTSANLTTASLPQSIKSPPTTPNSVQQTARQQPAIQQIDIPPVAQPTAIPQAMVSQNMINQPNVEMTTGQDKLAGLPFELQQQLRQEQARLQSQLSTTDNDKMKKLYIIAGVLVALMVIGVVIVKIMGK